MTVFDNPAIAPYVPGALFLGHSDTGEEIGIKSERHYLTVAGSGSGKGTAVIIPNLKRWPGNSVIIDVGGGNARATWQDREAIGQEVHIIDPMEVSLVADRHHPGVPKRLLKSFNPLAKLDPKSRTYGEDLAMIADGLVLRHDPKHESWDTNGAKIIGGVTDHLKRRFGPEDHNLPEVRQFLIGAPEVMEATFKEMAASPGAAARHAATICLRDLAKPNGYIGNAQQNTEWLDYTSMHDVLATSTFDLLDIKTKPCTVFLCIDPDYLKEHSRFLRLFVRMAVSAMAKGGENGRECLFILDEFFSLGKIDHLQVVAATMRKNGVHLWPILQLHSQLPQLYGEHGAKAFYGGADAHIYFGNEQDTDALEYLSKRLGVLTPNEITMEIPEAPSVWPSVGANIAQWLNQLSRSDYETDQNYYAHFMRQVGRPRLTTEEIAALTGKGMGEEVARSMIVFGPAGTRFNVRLAPYFRPKAAPITAPKQKRHWRWG